MPLLTCSDCGNQVSSRAASCSKCGAPVETNEEPKIAPVAVAAPSVLDVRTQNNQKHSESSVGKSRTSSGKRKSRLITKWTWFCLGSAFVLGCTNALVHSEGVPEAIGSALGVLLFGGGFGLFLKLIFARKAPTSDFWILVGVLALGVPLLIGPLLEKILGLK